MRALGYLLAVPLALLTIASFMGWWRWELGLLMNFRPHLAGLSLIALALALVSRHLPLIALTLALTAVNGVPLRPYLSVDFAADADTAPPNLRVLTLNMHGAATKWPLFKRLIDLERPDVVMLTEMPGDMPDLAEETPNLPRHALIELRRSPFNIGIYSRWPIVGNRIQMSQDGGLPVLYADLCNTPGWRGCLRIIGLHAARPYVEDGLWQRSQLDLAAGIAAAAPGRRVVLLGDLNTTPWTPEFHDLLAGGNLSDGGTRRGLAATWYSTLPFYGLFLDQVLVSPGIAVRENRLGGFVGSDHFPVIADLAVSDAARR